MAPDVEELIRRVNTLTLDKNRLKQKLAQLTYGSGNQSNGSLTKLSSSSFDSGDKLATANVTNNNNSSNSSNDSTTSSTKTPSPPSARTNLIAGVGCATSCEEDLLFMNELYRKRLEEYDENWELVQSKCSALLAEMNALQKQFVRLRRENIELENKYKSQCDETDKVKGELQTVVLNYETQLSTMSEHLSSITRQLSLEEEGKSAPMRSMGNPNYID